MKENIKTYLLLHILLLVYSCAGICSKLAAGETFLSVKFILYYGILLIIMVGYAVLWQQILKRMKLVTAYANKAVTIIWGMIWGVLLFKEQINLSNILGAIIIVCGVYLVVTGEEEK